LRDGELVSTDNIAGRLVAAKGFDAADAVLPPLRDGQARR